MSVFGGVICCISAFYEYGQNAAKRKGAPLVCFGLLPGGGYYTHDGANTDTQRRACLCSVVHVVHIRAGGVEALAVFCSVVDMDTQRGKYRHRPRRSCIRRRVAPLFARSLFVGASVLFCQNNSPCVV